ISNIEVKDERELPVYLRGIGWNNVEAELRKDLLLSNSVRPIHYSIAMNVSVKGYENSHTSSFTGKVLIRLKISEPAKVVELHSLGLDIQNVGMFTYHNVRKIEFLNQNKFTMDRERETIVIPSRRFILPGEDVYLEISYNGTSLMDGSGFYESWSTRENSNSYSSFSSLPFISLVTQSEPAGARRWFPCFDEPDKKATFSLSIEHPEETNSFSNTLIIKNLTINGRPFTVFERTVPLPTYVVALAITEQPVVQLNVDGYEFRGIGIGRELAVKRAAEGYRIIRNRTVFDEIPFIPKRTDILIVEDSSGAMENPGLITFSRHHSASLRAHSHEMAHMYFGNLVTLRSWNDIWVNEGFANFYEEKVYVSSNYGNQFPNYGFVSQHDRAIHSDISFTSSFHLRNYFMSQDNIHYKKAFQMLSMVRKFMGGISFDRAIKEYLKENSYGNGDAVDIMKHLIGEFDGDQNLLHAILLDWIYQPGKAILFVSREKNEVRIKQMRFTSTFFDEQLRDTETRWTIPLFCKVNGQEQTIIINSYEESTMIPIPSNSSFSISEEFNKLFVVYWVESNGGSNDSTELINRYFRFSHLHEYGLISTQNFVNTLTPILNNSLVRSSLQHFIQPANIKIMEKDNWRKRDRKCAGMYLLNISFDVVFVHYLRTGNSDSLFCFDNAKDPAEIKRFLHEMIITNELKIRNSHLKETIESIERIHPRLTMQFVIEELQKNPFSLPIRLRLSTIIDAVYDISEKVEEIRDFVARYPSLSAENYDTIIKLLEKKYVDAEYERRREEQRVAVAQLMAKFPSNTDSVLTNNRL
ncbi:hypothetical protein PFISCL1PPCAC_5553, partial [Pristionchus fissidentatus]